MIRIDDETVGRWGARLARLHAGQVFGLLFLIGPLADLARADLSTAQVAAISLAFAAFVVLYLALLPPIRPLARRGEAAIRAGLALLVVTAALILALGAPRSFASLFIYVAAAAALLLPPAWAVAWIGASAAAVGAGLAATGSDSSTVAAYTLTILAVGSVMAALGSATRANRRLREAREELAQVAVSEERLRIARDLHDLLGHTLSLIALKSELATKLVESDPSRAQAEMADVQRVTRTALSEVRGAVHGYRQPDFAAALEGARDALSAAGIDCRVDSSLPELSAEVESVLAWAVREATTNVVRHSGARACTIALTTRADTVSLRVDDDGVPAPTGSPAGAGLAGLAERARRLHGTLEAGARPEGGFRLRLTLPLGAT